MKNTFLVSDEEKQRILEMHSPKKVIIEQTLMPKVEQIKKGSTVNLYDEKNQLDKRFMLLDIKQDMSGVVKMLFKTSQTPLTGGKSTESVKVLFRCANEFLETDIEKEDADGEVIKYKSDAFVKQLRKNFCEKNKSGQWVPKAAFAAAGSEPSTMA